MLQFNLSRCCWRHCFWSFDHRPRNIKTVILAVLLPARHINLGWLLLSFFAFLGRRNLKRSRNLITRWAKSAPGFLFLQPDGAKKSKTGALFAHLLRRLRDYKLKLSSRTESRAACWESLTKPRITVYVLFCLWFWQMKLQAATKSLTYDFFEENRWVFALQLLRYYITRFMSLFIYQS